MRKAIRAAGVVLLLATACGREEHGVAVVGVERTGSAVGDGRVGAAASVRVHDDAAVGPIRLRLTFLDGDGKPLGTTEESLPFCAGGASCRWGATFFAEDFGGEEVARVRVAVAGASSFEGDATVRLIAVGRGTDGTIRGDAPGEEGILYVIASAMGVPRWGASVNVRPADETVTIPADLLPALPGEELGGYFYAGPVPGGP